MFNFHDYCNVGATSLAALVGLIFGGSVSTAAAGGFEGDNQGCAVDAPCFNAAYQSGNNVYFEFDGVTGWDFYNVRWATGGGEAQRENTSGHFTINNAMPNRIYTLKVQGCHKHFLGRADCSSWMERSVITR